MNVSKKNKAHTFEKMLARGWGMSVLYQGKEIVVIQPPNQLKTALTTTTNGKEE